MLPQNKAVYYPELDTLRFFAFLIVLIFHGPELAFIPGYSLVQPVGWAGVDLFFCLSAFLFAHLLRAEWDRTGRICVKHFYLRRILRIWPAYFVFVCVLGILAITRIETDPLTAQLRMIGITTFTDNIVAGILGNPQYYLSHLWTISYEEQFYALLPLWLSWLFARPRSKQALFLLAITIILTFSRAVLISYHIPDDLIYRLPLTHFESILIGLAMGLGLLDSVLKYLPAGASCALGGALLLAVNPLQQPVLGGWNQMAVFPLVGVGAGLLVYGVMHLNHPLARRFLNLRPLVFLGKISYGLYLYHNFMLYFLIRLFSALGVSDTLLSRAEIMVTALVSTILVSAASYRYLEKPFLRLKSRFTTIQSRPV